MGMKYIGQSVHRVDARAKVTGQAAYPGDINLPGQLWMKILFSQRTHAIIREIDISAALEVPGVHAIYTAKDIPNNEYGLIVADQPVLCGPGSNKPYADRVRCLADQVALVIAETEEIAAQARNLIKVVYEDLKPVFDPKDSMRSSEPLLHPERDSNVFCHYRIRNGDVEQGFADADVIVESDYQTPAQEHAYLQPEAGLGYIDEEGRVTVNVAGQWVHEDQEQIAHALNLPLEKVRVIYPAIGGAFGGREDMSVQIVLALAAWRLHQSGISRPVKIIWSREESIIGHHKRHPYFIHAKWGAKKDGSITAAKVELVADGGGYIYTSTKVLGNATLLSTGAYRIPNVSVDAYAVYTNNLPTGAFRGFGGPQALFQAESQVSKLAEKLGMDPVELRMKNLLREGDLLSVQTPLPKGVAIREVVDRCATEAGWQKMGVTWKKPGLSPEVNGNERWKTAWGIACGYKNIGFSFGAPEKCFATIELHGKSEVEKVVLHHAAAEVGQGTHTVMIQAAAEVLDVSPDKIELISSDTAFTENSGSVSASRMTFMGANAVKGAAEAALRKWKAEERPAIATFEYRPPATTPFDPETGKSEPNFAYGYVAIAVKVAVDTETGKVILKNVVCVDDVGQAINPLQVKGQIEGAIVQAAGYALQENFIQDPNGVKTKTLSTYLIPTILDIPEEIKSVVLEVPDSHGPWGAKGMGEMPYLCLVPAITSAVHEATGHWFNEFPLIPETVLKGLSKI
jgi:CO/xanthine dehydrogenase Mo-binding subunit